MAISIDNWLRNFLFKFLLRLVSFKWILFLVFNILSVKINLIWLWYYSLVNWILRSIFFRFLLFRQHYWCFNRLSIWFILTNILIAERRWVGRFVIPLSINWCVRVCWFLPFSSIGNLNQVCHLIGFFNVQHIDIYIFLILRLILLH
jgi:hypothetical protein